MPSSLINSPISSSAVSVNSSSLGGQLSSLLMAPDIEPGAEPSYELSKVIYLYHPLGQKMAWAPISLAQCQQRKLTVQGAPDEVLKAFAKEWQAIGADALIANVHSLARVYGLASVVMGCTGIKSDQPIDMTTLWKRELYFNVLDPLNTAGSLVLNQIPTAPDFNKAVTVRVSGEVFHRSRYRVVMNEPPVYLAYTSAAFGFVGRSVYQRALFPLKSFVRSMIADDMIATKLGLLVAKQKPPAGIIDGVMEKIAGIKRHFLREAQTGQVLSIDAEEEIETLNMQNVDGAGTFSRGNILKNIATAADMPAVLLENETMVEGFGEGTEDAKVVARYADAFRRRMQPEYGWFDNIVQYRAWNPEFYRIIQENYPSTYGGKSFEEAFSEWRHAFAAEWPSLLIEPESEQVKVEQTKNESIVAVAQTLLEELDPANKAKVIMWVADNISENKKLFPHDLVLDFEELAEFQKEQQEQEKETLEAEAEGKRKGPMGAGGGGFGNKGAGGTEKAGPEAKKFGRFG
jgi:hypothetical protein